MSLQEIVSAIQGEIVLQGEFPGFNAVSTDTRKIEKGSIFIALKGENFNANDYVKVASEKGAVICIIGEIKYKDEEIPKYTTIIKVKNTGNALLDLAELYKSKLNVKIIGVTGSAGKTSTKDLVAAALSSNFKVFKTQGNFNNQIGLPLMIFKLNNSYDIAVLEMGMNNLNEIHTMAKAAKPDIALITNVGTAHIGKLGSRDNILKAKLEITDFFKKENILIVNGDNDLLSKVNNDKYKVVKVGLDNDVDFKAESIEFGEDYVKFYINDIKLNVTKRFQVNVPGRHTVSNSLLAIACGRVLGMNYDDIIDGLKNLETTAMRLDIIRGKKFDIINDSYNANPDSMKAAIDVLKNFNSKRKVAILGTMGELGTKGFEAHKEIGKYAFENGVDILITVGEFNKSYEEGFGNKCNYKAFESDSEATRYLIEECLQEGDGVLVKASRFMKFETIVEALKKSNC